MKMKTILWIDDDEKLIDASARIFKQYGIEIVKATNSSRALTVLRKGSLDGVLLDVRLPAGESGLELLEDIHQRHPELPVVVFTGYPDYYDHAIAQRIGASVYFKKIRKSIPVDITKRNRFFAALHEVFESPKQTKNGKLPDKPLQIFCSYSHKDAKLRDRLEEHLASLKREGLISTWHDRKIDAGKEWAAEIDEHLVSADIILFLLSASFMASDYCNGVEVRQALKNHRARLARVIPIILKPVDWQNSPLGKLQALPTDGKPVTQWSNRDQAFLDIAKGLDKVVRELLDSRLTITPA